MDASELPGLVARESQQGGAAATSGNYRENEDETAARTRVVFFKLVRYASHPKELTTDAGDLRAREKYMASVIGHAKKSWQVHCLSTEDSKPCRARCALSVPLTKAS